jgi:HSP20 family protein
MLFNDPFSLVTNQLNRPTAFVPAADVAVSEEEIVLTMDLPGFTTDELTIEVEDNWLTVRGERERPEVPEGTSYLHVERPFGAFERRIQVPKGVDPDRVTASLVNGLLSLTVPKPDELKPKAIAIGTTGTEREQLETATA